MEAGPGRPCFRACGYGVWVVVLGNSEDDAVGGRNLFGVGGFFWGGQGRPSCRRPTLGLRDNQPTAAAWAAQQLAGTTPFFHLYQSPRTTDQN